MVALRTRFPAKAPAARALVRKPDARHLQRSLTLPVQALAWLGGQGTRAIAALVFIGIALPPLGELLKPYVTEAVFLLLCISFMRVDLGALRDHLRRPGLVLAATAWTTLAVPLMSGGIGLLTGLDTRSPDLYLALMLQAVASPMMASPALAAVMGLDSTLVLVTLITSTALVPITAPLFAYVFFGYSADAFAARAGAQAGRDSRGIAAGRERDPLDRGRYPPSGGTPVRSMD